MSIGKTHSHMGKVVVATQVITSGIDPRRARNVILLLAASMALIWTGYGIIMPIFARRLSEFGSDVETLGLMMMASALTGIVAAPFMGSLADRFGRRPIVLGSLAAYVAVNLGFLLASSPTMFIVIRAVEGVFMAGLGPAAMGVIADIAPENRRAQWIGIVNGGSSVGWFLGPVMGGLLYDGWGYAAPFTASAAAAFFAFVAAFIMVPETRTRVMRQRDALRQRRAAARATAPTQTVSFWAALPRPLPSFAVLLFINFAVIFAWTFFEPQLMFYAYDELGWTTAQFGVAASSYGVASMLGQMVLGRLSDRFGRKPLLLAGVFLHSAQYVGMIFITSYQRIMLAFIAAGLGEALFSPALSAYYLDITPEQHRSRVFGIKGAASSLGGLAGPALVVVVTSFISPQNVFTISGALVILSALLALVVLREPSRVAREPVDLTWEISNRRVMAAQASLRGVVLSATTARKLKGGT